MGIVTWVHQPYMEGWESVHKPEDLCRLNHKYFCGSTCKPLQVYGQVLNLTTVGRFMDNFRSSGQFFQVFTQTWRPFQVCGQLSEGDNWNLTTSSGLWTVFKEWHKPADLFRLMDNFRTGDQFLSLFDTNLKTLEGLWTTFGLQKNCRESWRPMQVYGQCYPYFGRFSKPEDLFRFMDNFWW